jgi:hypothetical protein
LGYGSSSKGQECSAVHLNTQCILRFNIIGCQLGRLFGLDDNYESEASFAASNFLEDAKIAVLEAEPLWKGKDKDTWKSAISLRAQHGLPQLRRH